MKEQLSKSELKKQIINAAVQEYINTPKFEKSVAGIAAKYGINKKTLKRYLSDRNIETPNMHGAKAINEDVFDIIDSEEKAYWLGFLYADGYVGTKDNRIGLSLALKDISHLEKFKSFLEWDGEISVIQDHQFGTKDCHNKAGDIIYSCRIVVQNQKLHNSLIRLGCVPNKSLVLTFPTEEQVPKKFIIPFIRGYFDGDGTLGLYPHSKKNPRLEESLIIVGTKPFLEGVQKHLGLGYLIQKRNCNQLTYRLGYSTLKAFYVAQTLYEDATIYLDRKYNIYTNQYCHYRAKTAKTEMSTPC